MGTRHTVTRQLILAAVRVAQPATEVEVVRTLGGHTAADRSVVRRRLAVLVEDGSITYYGGRYRVA